MCALFSPEILVCGSEGVKKKKNTDIIKGHIPCGSSAYYSKTPLLQS